MRVFVYFNLHKRVFSVKALEGLDKGRVVAHARLVNLADVTFKVSEAGRQRVLREKRKNVHAGIVGEWILDHFPKYDSEIAVKYDPYQHDSFVSLVTEYPIHKASAARLQVYGGRPFVHAVN